MSISSTKNIVVILVALVVGVTIGYGVGISTPKGEDPRIKQLESQISTLQSQIVALESQVDSLQNQKEYLENQVKTLQTQLKEKEYLESQMKTLQSQLKEKDSQISQLLSQLEELKKELKGYEEKYPPNIEILIFSREDWNIDLGYYLDVTLYIMNFGLTTAKDVRITYKAVDQDGGLEAQGSIILEVKNGIIIERTFQVDYESGDSYIEVTIVLEYGNVAKEYQKKIEV